MIFPPVFSHTSAIKQLLYKLDVLKAGHELHPVPHDQIVHLRRASLLKSSLYSARIEGNPLEIEDVHIIHQNTNERHKTEVSNLVAAYEQLPTIFDGSISIDSLKKLHAFVLRDISGEAGHLRTEESAIYNQVGIAVYLTPAPQHIWKLLDACCACTQNTKDPAPVSAGTTHIWFEKIHPFLDGNGRVGRLLSAYILKNGGYDFSGLVPFEQYLDEHRDDYYYFLGRDNQDVTEFIEFYLTALLSQANTSLKAVYEAGILDIYAHLLPRRAEIMHIIEDHKIVTFDLLARRFRAVAPRTLHNDISQLIKEGLVQKMGSTRGAVYTVKKQ